MNLPPSIIEGLQKFVMKLQSFLTTYKPMPPQQPVVPPDAPKPSVAGFPAMIIKWANAIRQWEGAPDSTNPGDLKYAPLTATWGATPGIPASDGGHLAHFSSSTRGYYALCNFLLLGCHNELKSYHHARTLGAFMTIYGGNPPQGYLDGISQGVGVPLSTDISTFLE